MHGLYLLQYGKLMAYLQDRVINHPSTLDCRWDQKHKFEENLKIFLTFHAAESSQSILSGLPAGNANPEDVLRVGSL